MDLSVTAVDWLEPEGARLRRQQQAELRARYGRDAAPGTTPGADDVPVFLLGRDRLTGEAVACGGLRPLEPGVAEITRMYVVPTYRGRGLARVLLRELEREALALGWDLLRLETGHLQPEAVTLYTDAGYRPIPRFGPYTGAEQSLCFEKKLVHTCGA